MTFSLTQQSQCSRCGRFNDKGKTCPCPPADIVNPLLIVFPNSNAVLNIANPRNCFVSDIPADILETLCHGMTSKRPPIGKTRKALYDAVAFLSDLNTLRQNATRARDEHAETVAEYRQSIREARALLARHEELMAGKR